MTEEKVRVAAVQDAPVMLDLDATVDKAWAVVVDTPVGRLAGMICWESYMPLARYAMYARGTQIYIAPTWDRSEQWLATLRHIAREGRCWVVGCCSGIRLGDIPDDLPHKAGYGDRPWVNVGNSAILNPEGQFVAGPLAEVQDIPVAEVDLGLTRESRWIFDVAGHYARPDVFQLTVNREQRPLLRTREEGRDEDGAASDAPEAAREERAPRE